MNLVIRSKLTSIDSKAIMIRDCRQQWFKIFSNSKLMKLKMWNTNFFTPCFKTVNDLLISKYICRHSWTVGALNIQGFALKSSYHSSISIGKNRFYVAFRDYSTLSFEYQDIFEQPLLVEPEFRKLDHLSSGIRSTVNGELLVEGEVLCSLAEEAISDISHFLRKDHLKQLASILSDSEASRNDKFVAFQLLKNANIAAAKVFPGCQDTGTAIVFAKKGQLVRTTASDAIFLSNGIFNAYKNCNLRYSQLSANSMFSEVNTKTNLPAQIDIYSTTGSEYEFLFITKGGGSANKSFLFQENKSLLNPAALTSFLLQNIKQIGTSACPPYHLAVVIGGLSAEMTLKTVKLATCKYLDGLNISGNSSGRAFRDIEWEKKILQMCQNIGIGAQFGGKYFCHDVRVIRLPRHGASCPVGIGVSCSADRQAIAKITSKGVFLEKLEMNPAQYLPDVPDEKYEGNVIVVDLNRPMKDILNQLSAYPIATRVSLNGSLVVARDIAHAKLFERLKEEGDLPDYIKQYPIYYAGPAKTPHGHISGSFGPTTAGRMDGYVPTFMKHGGSLITLAKGNRSTRVVKACKEFGGFYLGSIGGPAAVLGKNCIKKVEILEYEELGMEAVWKIEVENFPAFIVIDDKGNDFYRTFIE